MGATRQILDTPITVGIETSIAILVVISVITISVIVIAIIENDNLRAIGRIGEIFDCSYPKIRASCETEPCPSVQY